MARPTLFRSVIERLRKHYGDPERPVHLNVFELVLWENVAYLAKPETKYEALAQLRETVGTSPTDILKASRSKLEAVTTHGILGEKFATKLVTCAEIAVRQFDGDLEAVLRLPLNEATRKLQLFPGIGRPGAEKILLFSGAALSLAPESNGLRVLVRIGLIEEQSSYARTYAAAGKVSRGHGNERGRLVEAHLLLARHGRETCRRNKPKCDACPIRADCEFARNR